ncbi:RrF2 family transcriptional regulator [Capnocytophaga catalasegens]|uniref:Rrf2 family transcriptional regulator n=1 Tax=Capnocytophaga catalasegens TaxID=1004260 RepID=A0AAV5AVH4_9FLAO|nr:Rrf2 family transcriptional regulator [Capnocytophaga catalasegens]GIZ16466.1 hypothetical protein RCZ03_24660 [Capnocytophaga catalasegens]GJM50295.1 hypothetical protein RCZ15_12680 [Capnocytophaga catalasegens]GJM53812.1 hypothetical protein RCZ16_21280 [Capnocytophaga catalasegens]
MLSNSSKYAINAVLYLAVHASTNNKIGVKEIADSLGIPTAFLAKLLQILARKNAISSSKGPNGGFFLTQNELNTPLIKIVHHIDGVSKFTTCSLGLKDCSPDKPCPLHYTVQPFKMEFLKELEENTIYDFALKVKTGEAYLFI